MISKLDDLITDVNTSPVAPEIEGGDFVTVLTSHGRRLTKRWRRGDSGEPECDDYEDAKRFDIEHQPIRDLADLARVISGIGSQSCLIFGRLKDGLEPNRVLRRLHDRRKDGEVEPATIEDAAHRWLPIDADSIPAVDKAGEFDPLAEPERALRCVLRRLPNELQEADCVWQWTGSAGIKPDIRMRLFFWLDRPLTGAEIKQWLAPYIASGDIDGSIYTPTQPIYAAAPIFDGIPDPVAVRSDIHLCLGTVEIPAEATWHVGRAKSAAAAPANVILDDGATIAWATDLLRQDVAENGEPAIGERSDERTYRLIGRLRDGPSYGQSLSPETITNLLAEHWAPGFDWEWLEMKASGTYQNEPGCGPAVSGSRTFGPVVADLCTAQPLASADDERGTPRTKWKFRTPAEDARLPPLDFWDARGMLPRITGGCSVIAWGEKSSHKTGTVIKLCLDAVVNKGAKVLYLAPEGAHGIMTARLPAAVRHRGLSLDALAGRWHTFATAPGLMSNSDIDELIAACRDAGFAPDIVVVDTMTRALPGFDISAPATGAGLIMGMERLGAAFDAAVIAITHPGKDASKGAIGSSLIESLAFAIWHISRTAGDAVFAELAKMKDGPAEFTVTFKAIAGQHGAPVIVDMAPGEASPVAPKADHYVTEAAVRAALYHRSCYGKRKGLREDDLAALMAGEEPSDTASDDHGEWVTRRDKIASGLRAARNGRHWARSLTDRHTFSGGTRSEPVWFLPESEQNGALSADANLAY